MPRPSRHDANSVRTPRALVPGQVVSRVRCPACHFFFFGTPGNRCESCHSEVLAATPVPAPASAEPLTDVVVAAQMGTPREVAPTDAASQRLQLLTHLDLLDGHLRGLLEAGVRTLHVVSVLRNMLRGES